MTPTGSSANKVLGLIPARAGSKGIPNKNIVQIAGKPLIAWTIEEALKAKFLSRVLVSTDGENIAKVAREFGAEAPFLRPTELAQDTTLAIPPIIHALDWLKTNESYEPDFVFLLQPTSPLRRVEDIDGAIQLALDKNADSVIGITPSNRHPYWSKKMDSAGRVSHFFDTPFATKRRQDLPPAYDINGAVYVVRVSFLRASNSFYSDKTYGYVMNQKSSIDIDTPWDLQIAGAILESAK